MSAVRRWLGWCLVDLRWTQVRQSLSISCGLAYPSRVASVCSHGNSCSRGLRPNWSMPTSWGLVPEMAHYCFCHLLLAKADNSVQFSSVQSLSCVWLFETPWTAARQASLSVTNSQSPPKLMSIESVMPSSHLTLSHPLLLLPSIFPSIRLFSNESALRIRWPKY